MGTNLPLSRRLSKLRNPRCKLCPLHQVAENVCVMGDGTARLPIVVVGEAPGYNEDQQKRPFVGRAGKRLRRELLAVGLNPATLYLTNTVKCFPNGTPDDQQIVTCSTNYLNKELETIRQHFRQPLWILALGAIAFQNLCNTQNRITPSRGKLYDCEYGFVFPTFHPAYVERAGKEIEGYFRTDLGTFAAASLLDCQGEVRNEEAVGSSEAEGRKWVQSARRHPRLPLQRRKRR